MIKFVARTAILICTFLTRTSSGSISSLIESIERKETYSFNDTSFTNARSSHQVVKIVLYDKVKGYLNWNQDWFREAAETRCSTRCLISDDRSEIPSADILLFHAPTHNREGPRLPEKKPVGSLYVLLSMEQPMYATLLKDTQRLSHDFDVLATYSLASTYPGSRIPNLPMTYYPLNILSTEAVLQPARSFAKKTGYGTGVLVAAFVSNCVAAGAQQRLAYLEELMGLVQVHSYGKCLNNRQEPPMPDDPRWPVVAQRRSRKVRILSRYKFYLAFENLGVMDYVSEKAYEAYFAGTVAVYRGTPSIARFMPSNDSFVDANDLSAPQLAALLTRLAADEEQYNRFFDFKRRPLSAQFRSVAQMSYSHPNAACRLCELALGYRGNV